MCWMTCASSRRTCAGSRRSADFSASATAIAERFSDAQLRLDRISACRLLHESATRAGPASRLSLSCADDVKSCATFGPSQPWRRQEPATLRPTVKSVRCISIPIDSRGIGLALRRKIAIVLLRADFEKPRKSSPLRNASAFRCLHTFHVVLQLIEALVPNCPLRNHPVFDGGERLRNKMKAANASFLARSHNAALLEHLKVLRKGGQSHAKWTRKLRRRGGSQSQPLDNSAPRRVRQRLKHATDLVTARRNSSARSCPSADVSAHEGTHPFCRGFDSRVRRLRSRSCRRVELCSGEAAGA